MITMRGSPVVVAAMACCEVCEVSRYDMRAVVAESGVLDVTQRLEGEARVEQRQRPLPQQLHARRGRGRPRRM